MEQTGSFIANILVGFLSGWVVAWVIHDFLSEDSEEQYYIPEISKIIKITRHKK